MNKKAQIFTLLAIFIISLMFISFRVFSIAEFRESTSTRISTMGNFLDSIEKNLERQMFISGFRIIFLAENQVTVTGTYILSVNDFFNEAFFNGTVAGQSSDILNGATYTDLINSINNNAKKINVDITLKNSNIFLSMEDPWNVKFTLVSDFVMEDKSGLAKWEKQQNISALIPIEGFEDPMFIINTNALVSRKINQTIYDGIYANGSDVTNLLSHVNDGLYVEHTGAPNFLQRFEGDLTSDPGGNGIESFVNINELSQQGLPTSTKSTIDFIYFSSENPPHNGVQGMPSWFKIDNQDNHHAKYNVTSIIT